MLDYMIILLVNLPMSQIQKLPKNPEYVCMSDLHVAKTYCTTCEGTTLTAYTTQVIRRTCNGWV